MTIFDLPCLAVRDPDGSIYVSLSDLCAALGLDRSSQLRRIRSHALLQAGLARFLVQQADGPQVHDFIHLQTASNWLVTINAARVAEPVRDRLIYLQQHLFDAVWRAFAQIVGLPDGPSSEIEDLDELRQIDPGLRALAELAERQQAIEESQYRARAVWRDVNDQLRLLATRIGELEHRVGGTISKGQRGHIYQMVQAWALARVERTTQISRSGVFAATWAEFKTRFALARYEDLPITKYSDALTYIQDKYVQLTGSQLDIPDQGELGLE
ncbi:MAG: phage antirepressor N-terminal domain-containing protein [Chloroflexales bacterium]